MLARSAPTELQVVSSRPYRCRLTTITYFTASLAAEIVDSSTTIDSELSGLGGKESALLK